MTGKISVFIKNLMEKFAKIIANKTVDASMYRYIKIIELICQLCRLFELFIRILR
jgi:hypothetical protein